MTETSKRQLKIGALPENRWAAQAGRIVAE